VRVCKEMKQWFIEIGLEEGKLLKNLWRENLDRAKGKVLKKLCKQRERRLKERDRKRRKGIEQVISGRGGMNRTSLMNAE